MKRVWFGVMVVCLTGALWANIDIERRGRTLLERADARFYPHEGRYDITIETRDPRGRTRTYVLQGYKKGTKYQTVVWKRPAVNLNDVGMRMGDVIYYKPARWHKPEVMSYQAVFMDTGMSWGDILASDIAEDYRAVRLEEREKDGRGVWFMELHPRKRDLYARIDVWIDRATSCTLKRVYYTPHGEVLKTATYKDVQERAGRVVSFTVVVQDHVTEFETVATLSDIREENLPAFLFDVQNIGRIRIR